MKFRNQKILVTGGSGFIGSHLIQKLEELGAKVENFDISLGMDIQNESQLKETVEKRFDIIFHLAGFSGSPRSNKDAKKAFEINTMATISLLELIKNFSPKTKIIFSNSRLEYGKPQYLPVDESHPLRPNSAYGVSKLAATEAAMFYHRVNNLDVTVFRTSNVYGPSKARFLGYNIINHFISLAINNKTIEIFGNGEQKRDYIFIDDLVSAFLKAALSKKLGQIYNLGCGKGIKFKKMVTLILNGIGNGRIKYVPWPKDYKDAETGSYISDITKIKRNLNFQPKVSFKIGIKKTIEAYLK